MMWIKFKVFIKRIKVLLCWKHKECKQNAWNFLPPCCDNTKCLVSRMSSGATQAYIKTLEKMEKKTERGKNENNFF